MNAIKLLLSLSLSGSLVLLLLLACKPLAGKLGKTWQYYIWLVVVARLLIPVALPVNLVGGLFGPVAPAATVAAADAPAAPLVQADPEAVPRDRAQAKDEPPEPAPLGGFGWSGLLPVWGAVALALFVRKASEYRSFIRFVKAGMRLPAGGAADSACSRAGELLGLKKRVPVYINPLVPSPMLVGMLHPFIVAPDESACNTMVFLHELTHLKRLDALFKWAVQLAVCVHWFNPLVYLLPRRVDRACELSCDEAVLRRLDPDGRVAYGDTLLDAAGCGGGYGGAVVSMPLEGDAQFLKERLGAIMGYDGKRRKALSIVAAALVTAGALVCGCAAKPAALSIGLSLPVPPRPVEAGTSDKLARPDAAQTSGKKGPENIFISWLTFRNGYIFELNLNVDPSRTRRDLTVNGTTYPLYFKADMAKYADNETLLEAVRQEISEIQTRPDSYLAKYAYALRLNRVSGPYSESANQLTRRFYKERNVAYFAAVAKHADLSVKKELAGQTFNEADVAFFSILSDGLDTAAKTELARKAYEKGYVALFSILADELSAQERKDLAQRAYEDGRVAELSILSDALTREEQAKLAQRAYGDRRVAEFSVLSDALSTGERAKLAKRAYTEGDVAYLSMLVDALSMQEQSALAHQAYEEGRVAEFSVLCDALSGEEWDALKERAYREEKIPFLSILFSGSDGDIKKEAAKYSKAADGEDEMDAGQAKDMAWKVYNTGELPLSDELVDSMDAQAVAELAARAVADQRPMALEALADALDAETTAELAEKAYASDQWMAFDLLAYNLDHPAVYALAKRACQDGRVLYLGALTDELSGQEAAELAEIVYQKGSGPMMALLEDALTEEKRAELLKRAMKEQKTAIYGALA